MEKKKAAFTNAEIARRIDSSAEKLALMVGKGFEELTAQIRSVDERLILTKDELSQKISTTNYRIDDLATNRVRYDDHQKLVERVDKIERTIHKKR